MLGLHLQAAIDRVDLAGDVGRFGVGEELHYAGDIVRPAESAHRDPGDELLTFGGTAAVMSVVI